MSLETSSQWLGISAAAQRLNVHLTTLRRWAENGDIAYTVTPGGHRRFAVSDLDEFADRQKRNRNKPENEGKQWADRALTTTREALPAQKNSWMSDMSDESRLAHRDVGRQLLGLTMQFISAESAETPAFLEEAEILGKKYAEIGVRDGIPLSEMTRASLFFHDTMLETALTGTNNRNNRTLVSKINKLLQSVHQTVVEVYENEYNRTLPNTGS